MIYCPRMWVWFKAKTSSLSRHSCTFILPLLIVHISNNLCPLFLFNSYVLGTSRQRHIVGPLMLCVAPSPLTTWSLNLTSISHWDPWAEQNTCCLRRSMNSQLFIFHKATARAKTITDPTVIQLLPQISSVWSMGNSIPLLKLLEMWPVIVFPSQQGEKNQKKT